MFACNTVIFLLKSDCQGAIFADIMQLMTHRVGQILHLNAMAPTRWTVVCRVTTVISLGALDIFKEALGGWGLLQVAVDPQGVAGQQLMATAKVSGIPHAFVVDRDGIVQFSGHPMDPNFEAAVKKANPIANHGTQPAEHDWNVFDYFLYHCAIGAPYTHS